jgi:protein-tyrosine phosphatase
MIDLHTHLLPGFDDGAPNLETALAMLQMAMEHNTAGVVATPHVIEDRWFPSWNEIITACELLRQESRKADIQISIYPGAEVSMSLDILKVLLGPGPYCINGGHYLLVEFPAREIPIFAEQFFFTLQVRGIIPILAHPERYPELAKDPIILEEWVKKGIMTQLNGGSLLGHMGERAQITAELFLQHNLIHCIGSDAHGLNYRQPKLLEASIQIKKLVGDIQARQLLVENSKRVIDNQEVDLPSIEELVHSRHPCQFKRWLKLLLNLASL